MENDNILNLSYWRVIVVRHWSLIAICIAAATTTAGVFSFMQDPSYTGISTLYLTRQKVQAMEFENLYMEHPGRAREILATQIELIRSTPVLGRAVRTIEAKGMLDFETAPPARQPGWFGRTKKQLKDALKGGAIPPPATADERRARYIANLKKSVKVKPSGGGAFLLIGVSSGNPNRAAALANAIADSYLWNNREMLRRSALDAIDWLEGKVEEQHAKLEASEQKLLKFEGLPAPRVEELGELAVQEMTRLQEELLEVRLRILQAQTAPAGGAASRAADPLTTQEQIELDVQQALYDNLRRELVETMTGLDDLSRRYGEQHPDVISALDKLERLRSQIAGIKLPPPPVAATPDMPQPLSEGEIDALRAQEALLQESLTQSMKDNRSRDHEVMRYTILKHEVETSRILYDEMQSRLNEINISAGLDVASSEVFERAIPPVRPKTPDHPKSLFLGFAFGLILGLAGAAAREHLDSSLRDPQQANDLLRAPVLGIIPDQGRLPKSANGTRRRLAVEVNSESAAADAYRMLSSRIEDALTPEEARALLITSAVPGEGKSTTAANLALIMASSGYRTLLVDGDTRRSSLGLYFEHDPPRSFEGLIRGEKDAGKMIRASGRKNLSLLTCRPQQIAPDPQRAAAAFRNVITWSADHYDRVIIDMPVVMYVPGVAEAARAGASILLVHRPGRVPAAVLEQVREQLELVKGKLVGVVLNGVRPQWLGAGYSLMAGYYTYAARPLKMVKGGKGEDGIAP